MYYIFDEIVLGANELAKYDATFKARADVTKICCSSGFQDVTIKIHKSIIPKYSLIVLVWKYWRILKLLRSNDVIIIQYPINIYRLKHFLFFVRSLKNQGVKLVFIVHDLDYLRADFYTPYKMDILNPLKLADKLIVHTQAMKDLLYKEGLTCPMEILHVFDYLTTSKQLDLEECIKERNTVIFAGNLRKSIFLNSVNKYNYNFTMFNLYGVKPELKLSDRMNYCGFFHPNDTSSLKGGWGLVWDGDSLHSCTGLMGEYLKYNASHKLSLYISAGIPVIVWNESGLAQWIVGNKLGIAIDSLEELDTILQEVDIKKYRAILDSVRRLSQDLRSGKMLLNIIRSYITSA